MAVWSEQEQRDLEGILNKIAEELAPLPGKEIVVLCSRAGEVALWLGKKMAGRGRVIGLELSEELLEQAQRKAREEGLEGLVRFQKAEMRRLPFAGSSFDALVSEFVVYPTPLVTQIGQPEMARVLKPGGKMLLTDVITPRPFPPQVKSALMAVGLDYLCEATMDDFRTWMGEAGLGGVEVVDLTPLVQEVWQRRRAQDPLTEHRPAYAFLLDDPVYSLGQGLFYVYVRGER